MFFSNTYPTNPDESLGEGYTPPAGFTHGQPAPVMSFAASSPDGLDSELFEVQYPARFFKATLFENKRAVLKVSTGSGTEVGRLLARFLKAAAAGLVCLDYGYETAQELQVWEAQEDGRGCRLYKTSEGYFELVVAPRSDIFGNPRNTLWLYFQDEVLARQCAEEIAQGMFSFD